MSLLRGTVEAQFVEAGVLSPGLRVLALGRFGRVKAHFGMEAWILARLGGWMFAVSLTDSAAAAAGAVSPAPA